MRARTGWSSVKLRLAAIGALLIAASVGLTVSLTLRSLQAHDERVALDLSLSHTRRIAKMMSSRLIALQLALRAAAERMPVHEPIDEAIALDFLVSKTLLSSLFDTQFVSTPEGRMVALLDNQGVRPNIDIGDRAYFRDTVQQRRPMISPPMVGRVSKEPVIMLTLPVYDKQGTLHAVIGGSLRLATRGLMPEATDVDEDDPAHTVIIDSQARVIAHPDRTWLMRDAAQDPALVEAIGHWTAQGRPVEQAGLAGRFGDQLVSLAGVPDADWVVVRSAPVATVLAGSELAQRRALLLGAGVACGGGMLLLMATLHMLKPLRRIEACTVEVLAGRPVDAVPWPNGTSELGQLSQVLKRSLQARAQSDASSREVLDRLQAVMARSPVGIAFTRNLQLEEVSAHFHQLLGHPQGALVGKPTSVIYPSDRFYLSLLERCAAAFASGQPFDEEIEFLRRDGSRFWGRQQGQPLRWDEVGAGAIWILEDVTQQRLERETLAWASSHDALTGLANRAEFEHRLQTRCQERRGVEPSSALFIDLDRFKAVNDRAGHAEGDAVLVAVARTLERLVRQDDCVARMGGDEFAVLLMACDSADAVRVAEKMRAAIENLEVPWPTGALNVGASLGVVELVAELPDAAAVMAAADTACYGAKHGGRNGVRIHGSPANRCAEGEPAVPHPPKRIEPESVR